MGHSSASVLIPGSFLSVPLLFHKVRAFILGQGHIIRLNECINLVSCCVEVFHCQVIWWSRILLGGLRGTLCLQSLGF